MRRLLPLLLLIASCEQHHQVRLIIGGLTDTRVPFAFRCRDTDSRPLTSRGFVPPNKLAFNVVVDFIRLGGLPYASPSSVVSWCGDHDCQVVAPTGTRFCVPLDALVGSGGELAMPVRTMLESLAGMSIAPDAPDEPVVVRLVATTEPCASITLGHSFVVDQVVSCMVSVPVPDFDALEGDIVLDLPAINDSCVETITACATTAFE